MTETPTELATYDVSMIADALDTAGWVNQSVPPGLSALHPAHRMFGRAMPMSFRVLRDDERAKPGDPAQLLAVLCAIESTIRKGDVVVMASEGEPAPVGMIGGFVAQQYRNLGVAGAIVDGYIRDVVELRERGLPVFARGGAPAKLGGRVTLTALGQPVRFRGIDVGPDDYVAADADGIVVIPAAAVANRALVDWLRVMKADEQRCMGLLEQGTPYSKAIRVISAYKLG